MKNIGFFNSVESWGGGEKWHYEAALYFANAGYTVHFFLTKNSQLHKKLQAGNIHLHFVRVSSFSFLNPLKRLRLKQIFTKSRLEVLLINLPHDLKLVGAAARKAKIRKVIYRRGSAIPIKNSSLNRYIFSHWVTDILANSRATAETILQNNAGLFPRAKIKIIYNPIDIEEFVKRPYKKVYTPEQGEIIIGNLGRLEAQKNQKFLISLSAELTEMAVNHRILIAGSGRLEAELKQNAREQGVLKNLVFTGFLSNVKDLLMSIDIFMLPSLWEGFGFVLAEASLCKKPIVAFNVSSNPELIVQNKTGFLTAADDVKACAERIIYLAKNPDKAEKMGEEGFQYISDHFQRAAIMRQLEEYLET